MTSTIISTAIGCIFGGIISLIITHIYYKKSGTELEKYINELKNINRELQSKVNPLVSRELERDSGFCANLVEESGEIGVKSQRDLNSTITVRENNRGSGGIDPPWA